MSGLRLGAVLRHLSMIHQPPASGCRLEGVQPVGNSRPNRRLLVRRLLRYPPGGGVSRPGVRTPGRRSGRRAPACAGRCARPAWPRPSGWACPRLRGAVRLDSLEAHSEAGEPPSMRGSQEAKHPFVLARWQTPVVRGLCGFPTPPVASRPGAQPPRRGPKAAEKSWA